MNKYVGRQECPCKPIEECKWVLGLHRRNDRLPSHNRVHKKVLQLIRDSVCEYDSKTVHCCDARSNYDDEQDAYLAQRKINVNIFLTTTRSLLNFYDEISNVAVNAN